MPRKSVPQPTGPGKRPDLEAIFASRRIGEVYEPENDELLDYVADHLVSSPTEITNTLLFIIASSLNDLQALFEHESEDARERRLPWND